MKIGYVQNNPLFGEKEKNFKQIEELVKNVNADLLVFPELFATGYTFNNRGEIKKLAEDLEGKTMYFLKNISEEIDCIIVAGFAERDGKKIYNSSVLIKNQKILGIYRKIHLYFKENLLFEPGNKPFEVFKIDNIKIGMMICFDWIFPEAARSLCLLGADIIAHPANLVLPYCQDAMVTRCLENRVFAVTANRTGNENRGDNFINFTGKSQITSYDGKILSSAPDNETSVDIVEIDILEARNKSINSLNNLINDRKNKYYII